MEQNEVEYSVPEQIAFKCKKKLSKCSNRAFRFPCVPETLPLGKEICALHASTSAEENVRRDSVLEIGHSEIALNGHLHECILVTKDSALCGVMRWKCSKDTKY
jgi:hypothetical protein